MTDSEAGDDDTDRLIGGPALVLQLVAGADGRVDAKEQASCRKFLTQYAASGRNETVRRLLTASLERLPQLCAACSGSDTSEQLRQLRAACDWQLDGRNRIAYVKVLMELAQHIAEASGGFLGLGDPVSSVERQALKRLREALI